MAYTNICVPGSYDFPGCLRKPFFFFFTFERLGSLKNLELVTDHPGVAASGLWLANDWNNRTNVPYVSDPAASEPGLIHLTMSRIREEDKQAHPGGLSSEVAHCPICHILSAKAVHKASPDLS